jgi:hypothetical protein
MKQMLVTVAVAAAVTLVIQAGLRQFGPVAVQKYL